MYHQRLYDPNHLYDSNRFQDAEGLIGVKKSPKIYEMTKENKKKLIEFLNDNINIYYDLKEYNKNEKNKNINVYIKTNTGNTGSMQIHYVEKLQQNRNYLYLNNKISMKIDKKNQLINSLYIYYKKLTLENKLMVKCCINYTSNMTYYYYFNICDNQETKGHDLIGNITNEINELFTEKTYTKNNYTININQTNLLKTNIEEKKIVTKNNKIKTAYYPPFEIGSPYIYFETFMSSVEKNMPSEIYTATDWWVKFKVNDEEISKSKIQSYETMTLLLCNKNHNKVADIKITNTYDNNKTFKIECYEIFKNCIQLFKNVING